MAMTLFDPKSIQVLGADSNGNNVILCTMYVDTIADLPAPNAFTGNALSMGCRAIVINDNSVHRLNSAGQWVQITAGTATYTKTEIDSMIARIDATEAEDRAALVQLVDRGAKNMLQMTHQSGSITRYGVTCTWDSDAETMTLNGIHNSGDNTAIFEFYSGSAENTKVIPAGYYVMSGCPAGGSTATYRAILTQINGAVDVGNGARFNLTDPHYAAYRILISGDVIFDNLIFRPMVCTAADYAITPAFVPYAPTNRELYDMIRRYHS